VRIQPVGEAALSETMFRSLTKGRALELPGDNAFGGPFAFDAMPQAKRATSAPSSSSSLSSSSPTAETAGLSVNDTSDHIVNSTEAAAVTFTVSGLPQGEKGTVTFSDTAGHQVVVDVSGSGNYSANLSPLADGPVA
jgi:hypothetical protein